MAIGYRECGKPLVEKRLHATPERMVDYWRMSALGGVLSGTIGVQGHYANGLAALFIACGQDAACVAEAAVGVTRFEVTGEGGLYATVTLPNLIVGTVGGGTALPSQRACLELLGLAGAAVIYALARPEARRAQHLFGLSSRETELLAGLGRGVALWRVGESRFLVRHELSAVEAEIIDTDQAMRRSRDEANRAGPRETR